MTNNGGKQLRDPKAGEQTSWPVVIGCLGVVFMLCLTALAIAVVVVAWG